MECCKRVSPEDEKHNIPLKDKKKTWKTKITKYKYNTKHGIKGTKTKVYLTNCVIVRLY